MLTGEASGSAGTSRRSCGTCVSKVRAAFRNVFLDATSSMMTT